MTDCIFCRIVKGDVSCDKIYEDSKVLAFLDGNPASKGHTLVIPKKHSKYIKEVESEDLKDIIEVIKNISKALLEFNKGVNVIQNNGAVAGQVVNHVHFHVVPRNERDGIKWDRPSLKFSKKENEEIAKKIKSLL